MVFFQTLSFQKIKARLLKKPLEAAPEAQSGQATEPTRDDNQKQTPCDVTPIGDPYRVIKTIGLDVLTVFGFGFAGAAIVALVFHFRLRPTAAIAPLALAEILSYTLGFSIVGFRASDEQYWRRQLYVAIFAWPIGLINVLMLGLPITGWAFSSIWIALAAAMGGMIGPRLRGFPKDPVFVEDKTRPWNWRLIPLRTSLIAAASAAAIVILGTSYIAYDSEPKPETVYSNLKLGMTMQQVEHAEGNRPSKVEVFQDQNAQDLALGGTPVHDFLSQRTMLLLDATKLPNGRKVDDYPVWAYSSADQHTTLRVDFDPKTKALMSVACISTAYSDTAPFGLMDCPELRGIQDRSSQDDLIKRLGNPTDEKSDGDVRIFRYEDLGVQYFLTEGHVFMLSIFSVL